MVDHDARMTGLSQERLVEMLSDVKAVIAAKPLAGGEAYDIYPAEFLSALSELLASRTSQPVAWLSFVDGEPQLTGDEAALLELKRSGPGPHPIFASPPAQGEPVAVKGLDAAWLAGRDAAIEAAKEWGRENFMQVPYNTMEALTPPPALALSPAPSLAVSDAARLVVDEAWESYSGDEPIYCVNATAFAALTAALSASHE